MDDKKKKKVERRKKSRDRWNIHGYPTYGYTLQTVMDVRVDDDSEPHYETCGFCGHERIRYVHVLTHPDLDRNLETGKVCSGKLIGDPEKADEMERAARSRSQKLKRWMERPLQITDSGNYYTKARGYHILIFDDRDTGYYKLKIGPVWGTKKYRTPDLALKAAFFGLEFVERIHGKRYRLDDGGWVTIKSNALNLD